MCLARSVVEVAVKVGVVVGVSVIVGVGVNVGPNSCPGPQAEAARPMIKTIMIEIFMFIMLTAACYTTTDKMDTTDMTPP
jgi:hypothetical protein